MARSFSVHCHLMALIVCCSVQHKPSRQASPFRFTTSVKQESNLPFATTKERYGLNKMSALSLEIQNSPTTPKITFLNQRRSELLSTVVL